MALNFLECSFSKLRFAYIHHLYLLIQRKLAVKCADLRLQSLENFVRIHTYGFFFIGEYAGCYLYVIVGHAAYRAVYNCILDERYLFDLFFKLFR